MSIATSWHGGVAVLHIELDTVDASQAVDFKAAALKQITQKCDGVVLDMANVGFIDSAGLGAIVGIYKYWGKRGPFMITGVSSPVERIFRLTRMDKVFKIYTSVDDALCEFVSA